MQDGLEEKRQLHELADDKNVIGTRWNRSVLLCGAVSNRKPDGYCKALAGFKTNHLGYGRCAFCGGASTGPKTLEGKAVASQNSRKHGFYSSVLDLEERAAYEELRSETIALTLEDEIYAQKAKIKVYLAKWRRRWDGFYKRKLAENYVKYRCTNLDCGKVFVVGDLDPKPGYCNGYKCGEKRLEEIERWVAKRTPEEAEAYADHQTRVWYSESEKGGRSYYHAGTLEDRTLDRALRTLSNMIEKQARLNPEDGQDLLSQINAELRAASRGKVSISWGGEAQQRMTEKPENSAEKAGK